MTVRIGFLGAGLIANYHGTMLHTSGADCDIVTVWDPDPKRAEVFAERSKSRVATSEADVISSCDAVYVCTWTSEHERLVELAAAAGKPIFCEKPLAFDLPGAQRMVDTVTSAGVVNQVGLVLRDSPAFRLLRALVHDEGSGRVMSVIFRDDQYIPIQGMYASEWRGDVTKAGAGTLLEHSIHDLDMLEWLFGTVTSVNGRTSTFHGIDGIEDLATVTLSFDNGAFASLNSVWHDVLSRPSQRRMEVFCENAYYALEGDLFGPVRWMMSDGEEGCLEGSDVIEALKERGMAMRNPDEGFVEAVAAGSAATPGFADALRAHAICDAIYRSAADGGAAVSITT